MRCGYAWLVALVVVVGGCTLFKAPAPVPTQVVAVPTPEPERWILVKKTQRTLELYEGSNLLKTYPVVLGKDPLWSKLYEGDNRTPEGDYRISKKYFHPYWSRFMLLDYPTPLNWEVYTWSREHGLLPSNGRGVPGIGGAVGIHGSQDEELNRRGVDWTRGCVSLFNRDIDELYEQVPVGTRVVIQR